MPRIVVSVLAVVLAAVLTCAASGRPQPQRLIATGAYHACSVDAGAVRCWGKNEEGQLGDGTNAERHVPTLVPGLADVTAISASYGATCALAAGAVKCWGRNDDGQLGDGTTQDRSSPVDVRGLPGGVVSVSVGKNHACAVTRVGAVYCWGRSDQGQLGNGADEDGRAAVRGLPSVAQVATGKNYSCALTRHGAVYCWGAGAGRLRAADSPVPLPAAGLSRGVVAVAATGDFACALTRASAVKCWGENDHGQLGNGTTAASRVPVAVRDPGADLSAITVGANHACALSRTGAVRCWGRNDHGQLGDGTFREHYVPAPVRRLSGAAAVSAGSSGHYVCALTATGALKCWGRNQYGQLGDGGTADRPWPATIR